MSHQIFARIGKKIRETRIQQQTKLHELAETASISKGLLSKIENGRTIPSLPVLLAVVRALKMDLNVFFDGIELPEEKPYIHRKKSEYVPFEKEEALGFLYQSILSGSVGPVALEAVILELQPGSKREPVSTDGYEFKYVIKGEVEYRLGNETVLMREGDSLFFNAKMPHVPVNRSDQPVLMLVIYLLLP